MRPLPFLLLVPALSSALTFYAAAQSEPPEPVTSEDLLEEPASPSPATSAERLVVESATGAAPETALEVPATEAAAEQAFMDGDLPRALGLYRELARRADDTAEAARLLVTAAWLEFQLGNPAGAKQEIVTALIDAAQFRPRAEIYSAEFMTLFLDAEREAAEERDRRARAALRKGMERLGAGDFAAARAEVGESLRLQPSSLRGLFAAAQIDLAERHLDAALAGFERVLALERSAPDRLPSSLKAQALLNVGFIYFGRDQFEDASQALEEAVKLETRDPKIWFNLGLARQRLGAKGPGLDALRTAHELDRKDAEIALELARAYSSGERYLDAVAVLVEATQAHPDAAPLLLELAFAQRGMGNLEGSFGSLARAIELDPADRDATGYRAAIELAQASLAARNFGRATTAAEAAVRMREGEANGWSLLGLAQQASGKLPEAAASLERASALAPDRADIAHNLGTVYLAQRRLAEAESAFRRAVTLDPGAVEAAAALSRLEAQRAAANSGKESGKRGASAKPPAAPPSPRPKPPELGARLTAVDYAPLGIRGLLVEAVTPGGLADRAGLLADDLVLQAGGRPVTQPGLLQSMIASSRGISIQLSVLRAGKPVEIILHP